MKNFRNIGMFAISVALLGALSACATTGGSHVASSSPDVSVGAQYDTTHVYLDNATNYDAFVNAWTGTFGGKPSTRGTFNVMPVPANTQAQYLWSPVGNLSSFSFLTPIPFPFGQERTGWLVTDMDAALKAARAAGAEVVVDKFKDPIGYDAVVQFPGGVKFQLYWHFAAPHYDALQSVPETRVYVTPDSIDAFVRDFVKFAHGKVVSDDAKADGAEVGQPGNAIRRVRIESGFGKLVAFATNGQLPYPFGYEITGYEVGDVDATVRKAQSLGAKALVPKFTVDGRNEALLQFPGGYIAEIHAVAH